MEQNNNTPTDKKVHRQTNQETLEKVGDEDIAKAMKVQRIKWLRHVQRRDLHQC